MGEGCVGCGATNGIHSDSCAYYAKLLEEWPAPSRSVQRRVAEQKGEAVPEFDHMELTNVVMNCCRCGWVGPGLAACPSCGQDFMLGFSAATEQDAPSGRLNMDGYFAIPKDEYAAMLAAARRAERLEKALREIRRCAIQELEGWDGHCRLCGRSWIKGESHNNAPFRGHVCPAQTARAALREGESA